VDLQRHTHETHPPRCFTCGAEFGSRDSLLAHLEVHKTTLEERKKFACEWEGCRKRYTKAFALKNHVRTAHENEKPFVCKVEGCGRAFGFKKVLLRHEMTHTNPGVRERKKSVVETDVIDELVGMDFEDKRDIACTVEGCDYRFLREYDLKRHLASNHKQTVGVAGVEGDGDSELGADFRDSDADISDI
jgi:general transcription factor IIIA